MGARSHGFAGRAGGVLIGAVSLFWLGPPSLRLWLLAVVPALGAVVVLAAIRRYRPAQRLPWLLLCGLLCASVVAGADQARAGEVTSVTTLGYLVAYSFAAAAIVTFTLRQQPPEPLGWLDSAIALVAVGTLEFQVLVDPHLERGVSAAEQVMAAALPTYDLILLGLIMRLLRRRPVLVPAHRLLLAGMASSILADVANGLSSVAGTYRPGGWTDVFAMLCFLGVILAAAHPSMAQMAQPAPDGSRSRVPTLLLLLPAGAVVPGLLVADGAGWVRIDVPLAVVAGLVLFLFAMTRAIVLVAAGERLAGHDLLTGLPNTHTLHAELGRLLGRSDADRLVVGYLGLVGLGEINGTHGHVVGDEVIKQVGGRLRAALPTVDVLARTAGDEFAVLAHARGEEVKQLARGLLSAFAEPFPVHGLALTVSGSLGLVVDPADPRNLPITPELVVADADVAMYVARAAGTNRYAVFAPRMREQILGRHQLAADLRRALDHPQEWGLWVAYQPVLGVDDGRLVGVEALVRWHHPGRGPMSPAEFLPAAVASGLSARLDDFVLHEAMQQLARWGKADARFTRTRMAVNMTAASLTRPDLVPRVMAEVRAARVIPGQVVLEITEQAAVPDDPALALTLNDLTSQGIRLSIDDFGTGYSALLYLQRFPVRSLKLDRSLVDTIADGSASPLLRAVAALGHSLGLLLIAEGVESKEQLRPLRELGIQLGQGYLLAPPLTGHQVLEFAANRHVGPLSQDEVLDSDVDSDAVSRIPDLAGDSRVLPSSRQRPVC